MPEGFLNLMSRQVYLLKLLVRNPEDIIVDAKSGVSGRESKEDTHYCECNEKTGLL